MPPKSPRVNLISLGCPKNLVDSERILAGFSLDGFTPVPSAAEADLVLVNTCGFIDSAKEESIDTLLEAARVRNARGKKPIVVAAGCLVQRYGNELAKELPEIDAFIGPGEYSKLPQLARTLLRDRPGAAPIRVANRDDAPLGGPRLRLTPRHYAYLRIAEGCDNPCTFCSIPGIRGRFRSRPEDELANEAKELGASGAKELILIAQDSTDYGLDRHGRRTLAELLRLLDAEAEGVEWIRLMYAYPAHLEDSVLRAIADGKRLAKYVDVPIQHASTHVLRKMARRMTREKTEDLIARIRDTIPGVAIRTSIIVGSPGEREEDHQELLEFLRRVRIERLGTFSYSLEDSTPAAKMPGRVDPETIERRLEEVMLVQQDVAFDANEDEVGRIRRVLVDGPDAEEPEVFLARTESDAPEIDRVVRLDGAEWTPGEFAEVRITAAAGYDLEGERVPATASR